MPSYSPYVRRAIGTMTIPTKEEHVTPHYLTPDEWGKDYEIICVSRGDLQTAGLSVQQVDSLTDADMQEIAQELMQLYVDRAFWDDLRFVVRLILAEKEAPHGKTI